MTMENVVKIPFFIHDMPTMETVDQYIPSKSAAKKARWRELAFKISTRAYLRTRAGEAQNWRCCWCGCECGHGNATLEHVEPISKGGAEFDFENVAMACAKCNNSRGNGEGKPKPSEYKWSKITRRKFASVRRNIRAQAWIEEGGFPDMSCEEWVATLRCHPVIRNHLIYQYKGCFPKDNG